MKKNISLMDIWKIAREKHWKHPLGSRKVGGGAWGWWGQEKEEHRRKVKNSWKSRCRSWSRRTKRKRTQVVKMRPSTRLRSVTMDLEWRGRASFRRRRARMTELHLEMELAKLSSKARQDMFQACGPHGLCCSYSVLPLHKSSHGHYVNKRSGCVLRKRSLQNQVAGLQVEVCRWLFRWEMRKMVKAQLRQRK